MKILLIEDNQVLAKNTKRFFEHNQIICIDTQNWEDWLYLAKNEFFDVIILDIWLPWKDWLSICKEIREKWISVPIIFLTSRSMLDDKILGFDSWADDYLSKPFEYDELLARVRSLNRRMLIHKWNIINYWAFKIDITKKKVFFELEEYKLTSLEFNLLVFLIQNKWKTLNRKEILEKVWWEFDEKLMFSRTIDIHIWYLRKKFWDDIIETKKWFWYIIKDLEK